MKKKKNSDLVKWEEIRRQFYAIWSGHQKGAVLPWWLDLQFNQLFDNFKRTHNVDETVKMLGLTI